MMAWEKKQEPRETTVEELEKLAFAAGLQGFTPDRLNPTSLVHNDLAGREEAMAQMRESAKAQGCTCGDRAEIHIKRIDHDKRAMLMVHDDNCPLIE